jgi:hypothetical protein
MQNFDPGGAVDVELLENIAPTCVHSLERELGDGSPDLTASQVTGFLSGYDAVCDDSLRKRLNGLSNLLHELELLLLKRVDG